MDPVGTVDLAKRTTTSCRCRFLTVQFQMSAALARAQREELIVRNVRAWWSFRPDVRYGIAWASATGER